MSEDVVVEHDNVLRVSASSPPQAVAAAISKSITESHHFPTLRAIGHGAVGQTVKALAIARGYMAPRNMDLAFTVGFETIHNAEGKELSAMVFKVIQRD